MGQLRSKCDESGVTCYAGTRLALTAVSDSTVGVPSATVKTVFPNDKFPDSASASEFNTTEWGVVLAAAGVESLQSDEALESLCRAYWYPLYAHVRRRGHDQHTAEDLTQEFFARLLAKHWLKSVQQERGRFRTFLLVAMDRFLANAHDHSQALKRGGGKVFSVEDTGWGEERFERDTSASVAPESAFDRDWAMAVMERALAQLERDYARRGKGREFQDWKTFLGREATQADCEASAARLGLRANAVSVAIHRLRERYAGWLRYEVARTLSDPDDLEEESHYLFSLLNR